MCIRDRGYAYAVQAIQIVLVPKGSSAPGKTLVPFKTGTVNLQYQAYIQDTGWQEAVNNGEVAGITGKNLKIEALNVKSNTVKYRVYVQAVSYTHLDSIQLCCGQYCELLFE